MPRIDLGTDKRGGKVDLRSRLRRTEKDDKLEEDPDFVPEVIDGKSGLLHSEMA